MTFDPVHKIIYHQSKTGSGTVLIRSYDNGSSWQQFGQSNPFSDPFQLLPDPNDASKLWLTGECDTGPAVSRDGGATFSTLANFSRNLCLPIMLEDNRGQNIYIVNLGSFIAFSDGGNNWTESDDINGIFLSAALDPTNSSIIYLGSTYQGILKTTDAGKSWNVINSNMPGRSITELAIDPKNPQTVYAATDSGLYITLNGGDWWWPVAQGVGPNPIVYSVAIDPNDSSVVYAVTPDGVFQLLR